MQMRHYPRPTPTTMEDLQPNPLHVQKSSGVLPASTPPTQPATTPRPRTIRKVRKVKRSQVAQVQSQVRKIKPIPHNAASQPRDMLGRFQTFGGAVLKAGATGVVNGAKGIVSVGKSAHKTIKRVRRTARQFKRAMKKSQSPRAGQSGLVRRSTRRKAGARR